MQENVHHRVGGELEMSQLGWKGNEKQEEVHKKKINGLGFQPIIMEKTGGEKNNIEILSPEMIGTLRLIKQKEKPRGQAGLRTKAVSLVLNS